MRGSVVTVLTVGSVQTLVGGQHLPTPSIVQIHLVILKVGAGFLGFVEHHSTSIIPVLKLEALLIDSVLRNTKVSANHAVQVF